MPASIVEDADEKLLVANATYTARVTAAGSLDGTFVRDRLPDLRQQPSPVWADLPVVTRPSETLDPAVHDPARGVTPADLTLGRRRAR